MAVKVISRKPFTWIREERQLYMGPFRQVSTGTSLITTRETDWPVTTPRKRPTDLFYQGTARTSKSTVVGDSGWSYDEGHYGRYRNYPVSTSYLFSSVQVPSLAVDRELVYNKIRGQLRNGGTNLAMALAEYRQTAKLFYDLVEAFTTRGKSLVKAAPRALGERKRYWSPTRTAANAHLAWQYGVSPLINDMNSAIAELKKRMDAPIYLSGVETRAIRGQWTNQSINQNTTVAPKSARGECYKTVLLRSQWRARLNKNFLLSSLAAHGFTNPIALAYNLVPYSFVIDWWVNVGDVLESLDNLLIADDLYVIDSTSSRTAKRVMTTAGFVNGEAFQYIRQDSREAPKAISRVSSLRYKPSVSRTHILNGLALLRNFRF